MIMIIVNNNKIKNNHINLIHFQINNLMIINRLINNNRYKSENTIKRVQKHKKGISIINSYKILIIRVIVICF